MEWNYEIDLSARGLTARLIITESLARGWKVCGFKSTPQIMEIYIDGSDKPARIYTSSPPQMSYAAVVASEDKYVTNRILNRAGIAVPDEILIEVAAINYPEADSFIKHHKKVVVKPIDAAHGRGITMGVDSIGALDKALQEIEVNSRHPKAIMQEEVSGIDVRVICINYKYVAAITRTPAFVVGDGVHTIQELIEITNQHPDRGENYSKSLNIIDPIHANRYLGKDKLNQVLPHGQYHQVVGVANTGMGGVREDISEEIPDSLKSLAEEVAKTVDLPVCGVDFIVKLKPSRDVSLEQLNPIVIEVNKTPALLVSDDMKSKKQLEIINRYLDYIAEY